MIELLLRVPEVPPPTAMVPDSAAQAGGPLVGGNGDYDRPVAEPEAGPLVDPIPEAVPAPEREPAPEPEPDETTEAEALPGAKPTHPPALREETRLRLQASAELVESLGLSFHLGGALERIILAATQGSDGTESLREAIWLVDRYITLLEQRPVGADIHRTSLRLARTGEALAELRAVSNSLREEAAPEPLVPTGFPDTEPPREPAHATARTSPPPDATTPDPPASSHESLARELGMTAFRWALLVAAVVFIVLALTLIGDWRG